MSMHSRVRTFFIYACIAGTVLIVLTFGAPVHAADTSGGFVWLSNTSGATRILDLNTSSDLKDFMNKLFVGAIALGGILAVLRLAWAGFVYMGTDMWGKKEHAKEVITDTLIGLFLLLAIWIILKQINPDILKLNVDIKPAPSTSSSSGIPSAPGTSDYGLQYTGIDQSTQAPYPPADAFGPIQQWCYLSITGNACFNTQEECVNSAGLSVRCSQR